MMADARSRYNELVSIWDTPEKYNSWLNSQGFVRFGGGMDEYGYVPESYGRITGYQTKSITNDEGGISYYQEPQYEMVQDPKQGLMQQINTLAPQVGEKPFVSVNANSTINKLASEIAAQRDKYGTDKYWQGGARAFYGGATGLDVAMAGDLNERGITSLSQIKSKDVPNMVPSGDYDYWGEPILVEQGTKKVAWNTAKDEPLARQGYQHELAGSGNVWSGTYGGAGNTTYNVDFSPTGEPIFTTGGRSSSDFGMEQLAPLLAFAAIAAGGGAFAPELLGAGEAAGAAGLTGEAGALAANAGLGAGAGLGAESALAAETLAGMEAGLGAGTGSGLEYGLNEATLGDILETMPTETAVSTPVAPRPDLGMTPLSEPPELYNPWETGTADVGDFSNLSTTDLTTDLGYDAAEGLTPPTPEDGTGLGSAIGEGVGADLQATDSALETLMNSGAGGGPYVEAGDYFSANTPVTAADAAANAAATAGAATATAATAGLPALKDLIPLAPALTRLLSDSGGGGGGGIAGAQGWSGTVPRYKAVQERIQYDDTKRRPGSAGRQYFTPLRYEPVTDATAPVTTDTASTNNPTFVAPAYTVAETYEPSIVTGDQPITNQPGAQTVPDGVNTGGFAAGGLAGLAKGRYLGGPTDGMADKIPATIDGQQPAALSHGEFVIPADVVGHLGNGNSEHGAQRLYAMMDRIRKARTGTTKQGKQINPDKYLLA